MPITLRAAQIAAQQGRWHAVLGLQPGASADEVRKARRHQQRTAHTDKGGCTELSQLINQAADELLGRCPEKAQQQARGSDEDPEWRQEVWLREELERRRRKLEELERRAARQREERARREAEERRRREEDRARREADRRKCAEEWRRREHARVHKDTVRRVGHRRTRCKGFAYLGELAGKAFPVIRRRIRDLQEAGQRYKAQALTYAVEAEVAARRMARETRFPKTEGLAKRDAHKAARLDELRPAYQKAYDRLRYVRRTGKPEDFARMCVQRLLAKAWGVLLEMPALPAEGDGVALPDWEGFSP